MCNPKVDELSMMTYLSRFPHAKPKAGAPVQMKLNVARVRAYGPGLTSLLAPSCDVVTCEITLFRNNFDIVSVFYFGCDHA